MLTCSSSVVVCQVAILVSNDLQQTNNMRMTQLVQNFDFMQRSLRQTLAVTAQSHCPQCYDHSYGHHSTFCHCNKL